MDGSYLLYGLDRGQGQWALVRSGILQFWYDSNNDVSAEMRRSQLDRSGNNGLDGSGSMTASGVDTKLQPRVAMTWDFCELGQCPCGGRFESGTVRQRSQIVFIKFPSDINHVYNSR